MPISYPFYDQYRLTLPTMTNDDSKNVRKVISWDPQETTILSAQLHGLIFAAGGTEGLMKFNGQEMVWCNAVLGDATAEDTLDVLGVLVNGSNSVQISLKKVPIMPVEKIGDFTADLILSYDGVAPNVRDRLLPSEIKGPFGLWNFPIANMILARIPPLPF